MRMWEALQLCKEEGKIRHLGVSNFARKHIEGMVKDPRLVGSCHGVFSVGKGYGLCLVPQGNL